MNDPDLGDYIGLGLIIVTAVLCIILVGAFIFAMTPGAGTPRGESQYTGVVVDTEYESGLIFKNTIVHLKTNPRSSESEKFCVAIPEDSGLYDDLNEALRNGTRVTVTYSRGYYESPSTCFSDHSMVRAVEHAG